MAEEPKQERDRRRGFDLGTTWAKEALDDQADEVERVALLSSQLAARGDKLSAPALYVAIAQAIDGSGTELASPEQANEVWTHAVGEAADWPQSADFARGFAEDALDVW
jgi:hypothetical protein